MIEHIGNDTKPTLESPVLEDYPLLKDDSLTTDEKVDYIYSFIKNLEPLIAQATDVLENAKPMLEKVSSNPMLKMFGL